MTKYDEFVARKQREYGEKFDASALDSRFIPYFNNGTRVKIETLGETLTGTIGVTTGWKPCFLLMRTSRSAGSIWTLSANDKIIAVKRGREYQAA